MWNYGRDLWLGSPIDSIVIPLRMLDFKRQPQDRLPRVG